MACIQKIHESLVGPNTWLLPGSFTASLACVGLRFFRGINRYATFRLSIETMRAHTRQMIWNHDYNSLRTA